MHPLSVAELTRTDVPDSCIRPPASIAADEWAALRYHGGYPEPYLRRDARFSRRWRSLRESQLLKEDVRDLTRIQELGQIEALGRLLADRSGGQLVYSALANAVRASQNTVRNWVGVLCSLHYGFLIRPWYRNVSRALRKEPKWFLRDWSGVDDPGKRAETLCACHLLKAVEGWTDLGLGDFELRYIRDKEQAEVDFVVVRDGAPWFLVEAKAKEGNLSPALSRFQQQTGCAHAFQVAVDSDFLDGDCFEYSEPVMVPALTLFSQFL
jgi:hypothetical protein